MSKEIEQFEKLVQETYAWLLMNTVRRGCRVCEAETLQVKKGDQCRCVACGYQEQVHA